MQTLRNILMVGLCFNAILTACAPARSAPTAASTLVAPTPSSSPKPTVPSVTLAPTSEPINVGVPVIESSADGQSSLIVISSVTGEPFDVFSPIKLGTSYNYAFTPDGHTLALVSDTQLYLIDLPSWTYRTSAVGLISWSSSPIYSPDGTLLAVVSGVSDGVLSIVDAKSGEVKANVRADFSIRHASFTMDGKEIMVYGPHLAPGNTISVGVPKAALYSASDLSILWSVNMNGIRDGVFPKKADTTDIYQPGAAWYFQPGVVFDPNRATLYLVHGDADKLTTVDFAHHKVSTVNVHLKTSWLDQFLALTADVAYAKGMDGTTKQAVISPDGKFLYVSGSTETVTQQGNSSNWDITDTPIGLQVIATDDGTLVDQITSEANSLTRSPDGRQVFLSGWKQNNSYGMPWTDVYDISSRSVIKHLDGVYLIPTRRMDGKPILASSIMLSDNLNEMAVIDPASWAVSNVWKGSDYIGWLIDR